MKSYESEDILNEVDFLGYLVCKLLICLEL